MPRTGQVRATSSWVPTTESFDLALSFQSHEPSSKLLVSSLITPIVVPYITPFKDFRLFSQMGLMHCVAKSMPGSGSAAGQGAGGGSSGGLQARGVPWA